MEKYGVACYACSCCCFIFIIAIVGLFVGLSVKTVERGEWGLLKNKYDRNVDTSKVYESGRYIPGLTKTFLTFPSIYVLLDFGTINSKTSEGLDVSLDMSMQYQIAKNQVAPLFEEFAFRDYERIIEREASEVIRDTASEFTAIQFVEERDLVAAQMLDDLQSVLTANHITVRQVQLQEIGLEGSYQEQLERRVIQKQEVENAELNQRLDEIRSETEVIISGILQQLEQIEFDTQGTVNFLQSGAEANSTRNRLAAQTDSYLQVKNDLELSGDELLYYLFVQSLKESQNSLLVANLRNPVILDTAAFFGSPNTTTNSTGNATALAS
eukprot:gb/GECH01000310.1/.p1 GENE.gb/GECH01000310.1/~~gb/GECH01000310.1/.p1  ORF type:complete len:326 (+),score=67.91 gb/GECH01000310.1/:1-978(+)